MEKNNKIIEEANNTKLMKIIYKELMEMKASINNRTEEKVDKLANSVNRLEKDIKEMKDDIKEIKATLDEHTRILDEHTIKFEEHSKKIESLERKTDKICKNLEDLGKTEKLHFEYTNNKFNRIEQKIDSNFKYLDEKIDNTKNKLVSEITDILENFSIATTKSIKNIETKIDNEKNDRIIEINNIKGINDYNKLILRNLESRISILEEESEKYMIN